MPGSPADPTAPLTADSVRLALPAEAAEIAALQRRAWIDRTSSDDPLTSLYTGLLAAVDLDAMVASWHRAITRPPEARFRVLVAVAGSGGVTAFATPTPSDDPDADARHDGAIAEFAVDPHARRRGHGSRLLNACVDTLRADGFDRATWWVESTDDALRAFLVGAGWAADGGSREIGTDDETVRLKQVRLHTDISPAPEDVNPFPSS